MKKAISIMMALTMAAGLLTGCGGEEASTETGTSGKSTDDKLSFSVMTVNFGEEPTDKAMQEAWLEEMEKQMGKELDIDFQYVSMADYQEKMKIMLASGELPDMITSFGMNQTDVIKYGENGTFVELTQHMDKLPNYKKYLDQAPDSEKNIYSEDGKLYAFYEIQKGWQPYSGGSHSISTGAAFRKDIFDKHNIPIPQTVDEVYEAAKKLKEIYPDKYPIMQMEEWESPTKMLMAANHIGGDYVSNGFDGMYYDGTTMQYGPIQEGYKEALQELNKWYEEGLISPEYFTQVQADGNAMLAAGDAMIIPACYYGYPAVWKNSYPEQEWVFSTEIDNPKYGEPWSYTMGTMDDVTIQNYHAILLNAKSDVVDEMLEFMNCYLSDPVVDLFSWGIKDVTYTETDGEKHMTEEILKEGGDQYAYGQGNCRAGIFPQAYDRVPILDLSGEQEFVNADGTITSSTVPAYVRENFSAERSNPGHLFLTETMTPDEKEEYANIMTPVNSYAAEQMTAFITGGRSFDDWDAYVEEVKAMGDIDRAIEIQNSLERVKKNY